MDPPPVQYVKTSDGYDIAYRLIGGAEPALLFVPPPVSDVDAVWELYPQWMEGLAQRFRLIQFDRRGEGLSSRNLPQDLTTMAFLRDMEAVVDRVGVQRFVIWAWAATTHDAVRYAVAHPERVLGLILDQPLPANDLWQRTQYTTLPEEDWETFIYLLAGRGLPPEILNRRIDLLRNTTTPEDWTRRTNVWIDSNVEAELQSLRTPALVLAPQGRLVQGMTEASQRVAALIPGARFVRIDGKLGTANFQLGDPVEGLAAIDAFVAGLPSDSEHPTDSTATTDPNSLSGRELDVLRLLARGKSNPEIAKELFITRNTVQNHTKSIYRKTNLANRAQAAVYAQQHGLV